MEGARFPDWDEVHPIARPLFMALTDDLSQGYAKGIIPVLFRPFEMLRTPTRQAQVLKDGKSKVGAWGSAHQYGLAVDFVPYVRGNWSWQVSSATWDTLRIAAHARGLLNDISWDRAHVEHPAFALVQAALRGSQPTVAAVRQNASSRSERP